MMTKLTTKMAAVLLGTTLFAAPALAEDFVIGVTAAQSGWLATYDQPSYAGFKFCIDEINAKGGLGGKYKAVIDVRDTRSDTAEAVKVAQEFADKKVNFIVSPADGDPTMAMGQITSPAGIPTMTFAGTAPVLTSVGEFVFGSYPGDNQQAAVLGAYAAELGYKTAWLLKSPDSSYTMKGPEYFGQVFEAKGGKVTGEGSYTRHNHQGARSAAGRDRHLGLGAGLPRLHQGAAWSGRDDAGDGCRRARHAHGAWPGRGGQRHRPHLRRLPRTRFEA